MSERIKLFNIEIDNLNFEEACHRIIDMAKSKSKSYVVTPNVDHIVKLVADEEFVQIYKQAELVLADGMPLVWLSRLLRKPLKMRVTGADVFPRVCELSAKNNLTVFLLGAQEGVASDACEVLKAKYPNLNIVATYSPPIGFEKNIRENNKIIKMINLFKPEILFVGVGAPKQEKWIYNNINMLDIKVAIGVGAAFDFVAGNKKRAPSFFRNIGLEFFWRFLSEPTRLFRRYFIEDATFLRLAAKEMFFSKQK